jgi:CDP-paratose 2-epimerase
MNIALVTGSAGLIGSEAVSFFSEKFDLVIGIDNNMRQYFFGQEASTAWNRNRLEEQFANYKHYQADIREVSQLEVIFKEFGADIKLILHTEDNFSRLGSKRTIYRLFSECKWYTQHA